MAKALSRKVTTYINGKEVEISTANEHYLWGSRHICVAWLRRQGYRPTDSPAHAMSAIDGTKLRFLLVKKTSC